MFNKIESISWSGISATPASFTLRGGQYGLTLHASAWGTATMQRQTSDGSWVACMTAVTADGYSTANLPSGTYRMSLSGVTGLYGDLVSIVTAQ